MLSHPKNVVSRNRSRSALTGLASVTLASAALTLTTGTGVAAAATTSGPPLVVYSAQGYDSTETTAFQKATGITVQLDDDSTGPLLTKVEAEKNNPKWGLLWVDGATAFASLDQQGLLMKGWEPTVNWNTLGKAAVPADKSYVPTGLTMAGTLVYDDKTVTSPPSTWQQLLSSKWNGDVGMNDPAVSGPTYPFVAGMMNYLGRGRTRASSSTRTSTTMACMCTSRTVTRWPPWKPASSSWP